jgi:hypothetical protein
MPRHRRRRFARNRRAQRKRERLDRFIRDFIHFLAEYPSSVTLLTEPLFPNLNLQALTRRGHRPRSRAAHRPLHRSLEAVMAHSMNVPVVA